MLMKTVVYEHFLSFFVVSSDRDAEAIRAIVMRAMENFSPTTELSGQTHDGARCMTRQQGGVHALV